MGNVITTAAFISPLLLCPMAVSEEIWKSKKDEGETSRGNDIARLESVSSGDWLDCDHNWFIQLRRREAQWTKLL